MEIDTTSDIQPLAKTPDTPRHWDLEHLEIPLGLSYTGFKQQELSPEEHIDVLYSAFSVAKSKALTGAFLLSGTKKSWSLNEDKHKAQVNRLNC